MLPRLHRLTMISDDGLQGTLNSLSNSFSAEEEQRQKKLRKAQWLEKKKEVSFFMPH